MASSDNVFLLLGPEEGEKSAFVSSIVEGIGKRLGAKPEIHRFYPADGDLGAFLDGLQTGDLFASHRVAILANVDDLGKPDVERLAATVSAPPPEVTLVMLSSAAYLGARDPAGKLAKLVPEPRRKVFWELFAGQKVSWVTRYFKSRSMDIQEAAVQYLLDVVESNTRDLRAECDKLALFHGPGATISLDTVEQFVYHSKEENAFTLFDRLAERALEPALEVLYKILLSPIDGAAVLGGLLMQFRRLLELELLMEEGVAFEAAVERAGIRGKRNQQSFRAAAKRYDIEEVRAVIELTAECTTTLRSFRTELQGLLLSRYLYLLVVLGGRRAVRAGPSPAP